MGRTAAFILVPDGCEPDDPGDWITCSGASPGWLAFASDTADPEDADAPWDSVRSPYLAAFVMDSDFCDLAVWHEGRLLASWAINPESRAAYGFGGSVDEPSAQVQAKQRSATITALKQWCAAAGLEPPDAVQLDELLAKGWVLADEGLFALLEMLRLVPEGGNLIPEKPLIDPHAFADLLRPQPAELRLADGGDADTLPERAQRMLLAAPIDHESPYWDWFVRSHELESWGKPGCVVADSVMEVPSGRLTGWAPWTLFLATDPPVSVVSWMGALGDIPLLPDIGPWTVIPQQADADPGTAIRWAHDNVGTCLEPPSPNRDLLLSESVSPPLTIGMDLGARAWDVDFSFEVSTYLDLLGRTDAVVSWLEEARGQVVDPFATAFAGRLDIDPREGEDGPPYGAVLSLHVTSLNERSSSLPATAEGWARALGRMSKGELRSIAVSMSRLNGLGQASIYHKGFQISVELRDQFSGASGPLADGHPAKVVVTVAEPLLRGVPQAWIDVVLALMRKAVIAFDADYGFATADGNAAGNIQSPYERRHNLSWSKARLDTHARGVHWGNLFGPGHLAAIGGAETLRRLAEQGYVARLEQWDQRRDLWWFQLSDDPFGPDRDQADKVADLLPGVMPQRRS